ncbi:transient receptor potential cation channel subfamily V member 1 isoform 2-T2 [Synchiropus picturatus]
MERSGRATKDASPSETRINFLSSEGHEGKNKKTEMFGIHLEIADLPVEKKTTGKMRSSSDAPHPAMDTDYQEDIEPPKPQCRINPNFSRLIQGEEPDNKRTSESFTIDRLFKAAASGDIKQLDGLHTYLQAQAKMLTSSSYQSYGKTALMKALLHLHDGRNETVELLIDISEKMGDVEQFVNAEYNNSYYKGQTALHIAIERRSLHYVQLLVSKGAGVHAKASGKFFQPRDGATFYFGELPLSLAACTNQPDIVDFLLTNDYQRAQAQITDSHGNTVLHALVMVANNENTEFICSMYSNILQIVSRLDPDQKVEDIENSKGLTPLKLAAKTGKNGIFSHILKREFPDTDNKHLSRKFTEWVYGPVQCSLYDLASVDSYEANSVLEILVYGSDIPNRHEMLQTEPLSRLLDHKWKSFASGMFFFNFLVYMVYLIIFTILSYNKKDGEVPFPLENDYRGYLFLSAQIFVTLSNCYFFVGGLIDMKRKRPKLMTLLIDGYYEILFCVQSVLFLVSAGLYLVGRQEYLGFLVLCLALSWVNLLYFSRGDKHMGIYSIMIQKMILGDILRFLFVYVVFLFGFSAAVVTLLIEPPPKNITKQVGRGRFAWSTSAPEAECVKPTYRNISYTTLQLFKFTIGMGDMEFTEGYQYKEVFYILLIGYIILTYILLLNMLIALMNRTVERITMDSACIWRLQRAITILDIERKIPFCLKRKLRCGVEKDLGSVSRSDVRHCFRVEEVNWNKWNTNLGKINEEPGYWDGTQQVSEKYRLNTANRGWSRRNIFGRSSKSWRQPDSTEMNLLDV